jgi:hypothetical protein
MMNDSDYGLTRGRLHAGRKAGAQDPVENKIGLGVLELLRPREPAAPLVGRRALGYRAHAFDLRHPDVHPAESLAFARRMMALPAAAAACARIRAGLDHVSEES